LFLPGTGSSRNRYIMKDPRKAARLPGDPFLFATWLEETARSCHLKAPERGIPVPLNKGAIPGQGLRAQSN